MIRLSRLNNEAFFVNSDLIEFVEQTPDTIVSMMSGRKLVVTETPEHIRDLIIEYKQRIMLPTKEKPEMDEEC